MIIRGSVIKSRREELSISQQDLSRGICHQSLVSRLETSNHITSMTILQHFCQRLAIKLDDVVHWSEEDNQSLCHVRTLLEEHRYKEARKIISVPEFKAKLPSYTIAEFHLLYGQIESGLKHTNLAVNHLNHARAYASPEQRQLTLEIESELAAVWIAENDLENAREVIANAIMLINAMNRSKTHAHPKSCVSVYLRAAELAMIDNEHKQALEFLHDARVYVPKMILNSDIVKINFLEGRIRLALHNLHESCHSFIKAYSDAETIGDAKLMDDIVPYLRHHNVDQLF
ncbi:helix-turn-helix domain-containing protein [Weissella soli]|uniref:helix-turn-helix domain-containing protein n=1 Tax=Weissella soli TaxID=155866 RepID=UPI0021BF5C37|nr:helix-turn-helix transcriptional regulator [Weissella soli]